MGQNSKASNYHISNPDALIVLEIKFFKLSHREASRAHFQIIQTVAPYATYLISANHQVFKLISIVLILWQIP
jgi:hypothetical protein